MDLNKLHIFFVLAQTGNYSKCAEKLCITQSAVSHAMKRLETGSGIQLIDRTGRKFALTSAGRTLFESCRTIFFELEHTREKLLKSKDYPEVINLGTPVEFGISIVMKQIKGFLERHPGIHVDFQVSHNLLPMLLNDELDMIIDCRPHGSPELKVIDLFKEEYAVIASPEYAQEKDIREISDIERCNVLSLDKNLEWWANFINCLPVREQNIFRKVTRINHIRGIINATLAGIGIGFVPKYTVMKELAEGSLVRLFPDLDILNDQINIYIKHNRAELEKNRALIEYIKKLRLQ